MFACQLQIRDFKDIYFIVQEKKRQDSILASLNHLLDKLVDVLTLLSACTTLVEVVKLCAVETTSGSVELEGPQEI